MKKWLRGCAVVVVATIAVALALFVSKAMASDNVPGLVITNVNFIRGTVTDFSTFGDVAPGQSVTLTGTLYVASTADVQNLTYSTATLAVATLDATTRAVTVDTTNMTPAATATNLCSVTWTMRTNIIGAELQLGIYDGTNRAYYPASSLGVMKILQ